MSFYPQAAIVLVALIEILAGLAFGIPVDLRFATPGLLILILGMVATLTVTTRVRHRNRRWLVVIPLADVVASAVLGRAVDEPWAFTGLLLALALSWLAFAFTWKWSLVAVALTLVWPLSVLVTEGVSTMNSAHWVGAMIVPAISAVFVAAIIPVGRAVRAERAVSAERAATVVAVLQASSDSMLVFDRGGRVRLSNDAAQRLAKRAGIDLSDPDAMAKAELYAVDHETRIPFAASMLVDAVHDDRLRSRTVWVGRPGDQIAYRYTLTPIGDGRGENALLMTGTDVTELVDAVESRDRFIEILSHELRTPVTVILGELDLALSDTDWDRLHTRLERMDNAGTSLRQTMERILTAQSTQLVALRDTTDVARGTHEVLREMQVLADQRQVRLERDIPDDVRSHVSAVHFKRIVRELVSNAILATPRGGKVEVRLRSKGGAGAWLAVADTGVGMSPRERERAFERYYRTERARAQAVPGAGLGLSIAAIFAEYNDIRLSLLENPDGGTIAEALLPPAQDVPTEMSPATSDRRVSRSV